jgi:hypothetical protein
MFPDNSYFTERMVRAKQEDIAHEVQEINRAKLLDGSEPSPRGNVKDRMWVVVGLLGALIWLFGLIH